MVEEQPALAGDFLFSSEAQISQLFDQLKRLAMEAPVAVQRLSTCANQFAQDEATETELEDYCQSLLVQFLNVKSCARVAWKRDAPTKFMGALEPLRRIPAEFMRQFVLYFKVIAAGAQGRASSGTTVVIDIQPLIDRATKSGMAGLAKLDRADRRRAPQTKSSNTD